MLSVKSTTADSEYQVSVRLRAEVNRVACSAIYGMARWGHSVRNKISLHWLPCPACHLTTSQGSGRGRSFSFPGLHSLHLHCSPPPRLGTWTIMIMPPGTIGFPISKLEMRKIFGCNFFFAFHQSCNPGSEGGREYFAISIHVAMGAGYSAMALVCGRSTPLVYLPSIFHLHQKLSRVPCSSMGSTIKVPPPSQ